jgi:ADP-ribose pyrophosphatase YjhB (NUDIX family)
MPKAPTKTTRLRPTKEVSVMAWIEDSDQKILLVRQAAGLRLWTLPGGKVKRGESLVKALKREVYEETALRVQIGSLLGVLDRRAKDAIALLFAAIPNLLKRSRNKRKLRRLGPQRPKYVAHAIGSPDQPWKPGCAQRLRCHLLPALQTSNHLTTANDIFLAQILGQ